MVSFFKKSTTLINLLPNNWVLHREVALRIINHRKLLLSYSGGLDSTVLLDILTDLRNINNCFSLFPINVRAVHIHHGLNKDADIWANYCFQQCKIRNVPFCVIHIDCHNVGNKLRNIEELARSLRYQALCKNLHIEEKLLTAHHMDDQVETFFLALKRGSGLTGLSAMTNNSHILYQQNQYELLRPLLNCSRVQLQKYAFYHKINWMEDDTNKDIYFDRNFLRVKILPLLYKRWPSFNKIILRTTTICRDQENLLRELLSELLIKLTDTDGSLFFRPLIQYSVSKRRALLRFWLMKFFKKIPSYQFINRIYTEVILSKKDANPILYLNQYICRRFREKLYILPAEMASSMEAMQLTWHIPEKPIVLPCKLGILISKSITNNKYSLQQTTLSSSLNQDNILFDTVDLTFSKKLGFKKILTYCFVRPPREDEEISIRFGHINGLLYILSRNKGRYLKKIWQELDIPPWLRTRIPLLFYNEILIAAIGIFETKDSQDTENKNFLWQIFWVQDFTWFKFFKGHF